MSDDDTLMGHIIEMLRDDRLRVDPEDGEIEIWANSQEEAEEIHAGLLRRMNSELAEGRKG